MLRRDYGYSRQFFVNFDTYLFPLTGFLDAYDVVAIVFSEGTNYRVLNSWPLEFSGEIDDQNPHRNR